MASETFSFEHTAAANIYFRIFNMSGQVFDFNDNTFKSLAAATTPYVTATEKADMGGTGRSGYVATINLTNVNNTGAANRYELKAYDNAAPADGDNPVSDALPFTVKFGKLGERPWAVQFEVNVKSTAGSTAQLSVWLEYDGEKIDIDTVDATCSGNISMREHGAGADLFSKALAVGDLTLDVFQVEQASPNFVDDREYNCVVSVTENGTTHTTEHSAVVVG